MERGAELNGYEDKQRRNGSDSESKRGMEVIIVNIDETRLVQKNRY